jgi:uncharacterized protein YggE
MRKAIGITFLLLFGVVASAYSQDVQVNRQNRTVDVTVTASVSKFANLAEVRISCDTKSPTRDQSYQKNVEKADKVVKALLGAGVPKDDIVSAGISLEEQDRDLDETRANPKRAPSFEAVQSWTVRVAAADAQKVIDIAVQAGADTIGDVNWMLSNPDETESQARLEALQKARATAVEIANGLGAKVGEAIYVSNQSVKTTLLDRREMAANVVGGVPRSSTTPNLKLQLFPERIEKQATVRVVFALD